MKIGIERRLRPNGDWHYTEGYSSIDAAKAACREFRRGSLGNNLPFDFRIYVNDSLHLINVGNKGGWRLSWGPGNGLSRKEQAS